MDDLERKRKVLKKLREWREIQAQKEGVELFRIISNEAVNGIVESLPTTKDELLEVKGIAEKKLQKYGRDILVIVAGEVNEGLFVAPTEVKCGSETDSFHTGNDSEKEKIFTVSDYLEILNVGLRQFEAKVVGEISSLDIRGNYLFFTVKDEDGSSMPCFMWASNYKMSGVCLEEGLEILLLGFPKIHKPSGRISFEVNMIELVGEGALKKAYLELKKKLEKEGLFLEENKKVIPEYPQKIGLVTSGTGAVIHDFLNNIGKFGFKIFFHDARVEGALAVKELVSAVRYFKKSGGIDVLVIIRGGGSLESLQAFNNEVLVREVATCSFPVLVGIGHDKDLPLVSFVADRAESTPTAVAKTLNTSWEQALSKVRFLEQRILNNFTTFLYDKKNTLAQFSQNIEKSFRGIFERFRTVEEKLFRNTLSIGGSISRIREKVLHTQKVLVEKFENGIYHSKEKTIYIEKVIIANNPMRQIKLGYSIAFAKGKVVRSAEDIGIGDEIDIRVSDGMIIGQVLGKK
jgi:exodeoxyribonuclease VII large subunit